MKKIICLVMLLAVSVVAHSADESAGASQESETKKADAAAGDFSNFNFGVGIGIENFDDAYIDEASINGVNRVVTVDKETSMSPSLWLVTNWTANKWGSDWVKPGFYIGVKAIGKDSTALDAASIGFNLAFLRKEMNDKKRSSLNVGLGYVVHETRRFSTGIEDGQSLPATFDEIKYKDETEGSWMIMISTDIL